MSTPFSRYKFLSEGWENGGHPHHRDENGFCGSCGASANEYHYRCVKKEES